jgi:peptidyl-prolyl cis-trans isomerase B (cyclophilin B)
MVYTCNTDRLNGKHAVFGKVTKGIEVVDAIKQGDKLTKLTKLTISES